MQKWQLNIQNFRRSFLWPWSCSNFHWSSPWCQNSLNGNLYNNVNSRHVYNQTASQGMIYDIFIF